MQKVYTLLRKSVKWRAVLLVFMTVQSNAFAAAQDSSNVSLNFTNQPIENVFIALEKQTGYTVFFSGSTLDGKSPVSVKVSQVTLSNALAAVLRGRNITWTIKHKGIVLSKKPAVAEALPAQPVNAAVTDTVPLIDVAGVVVDPKGNPIPAATVSLKGFPRGQGTDNSGRFSFTRVPANGTLVFSSLGYDPKQVKIGGRTEIRIALDSAIRDIQGVEVFSTGYQSIPKERATGSFVQLDNAAINRTVSTDILDRIMNITSSLKREAGMNSDISIRGFSTINANMKPLIVIDGFPYEESPELGQVILNNLNPNDVESITILRDAASASIWGARSGNGVIVIKTKKGNYNRKLQIQLNTNFNFIEKPDINSLKIISSKDAVAFEKKRFEAGEFNDLDDAYPSWNYFPSASPVVEILLARRRGEISQAEADERLNQLSNHDTRDDINKYLLRTGFNQQYNISLSGGTAKNSFFSSIGYDNISSSTVGNNDDRFTFRFDNTYKPIRQIEVNTYLSYTQSKNNNNGLNYTSFIGNGSSPSVAPYARLADENGTPLHVPAPNTYRVPFIDTLSATGLLDWHYRPLDELKYANNTGKNYATRMGGEIRYFFLPGLSIEGKGQYEKRSGNIITDFSPNTYTARSLINSFAYQDPSGSWIYPVPLGTIRNFINSEQTNWNIRGQLNADKSWDEHQLTGILGYEASEALYSYQIGRIYGYDPVILSTQPLIDYQTVYDMRPMGNNGSNRIPTLQALQGTVTRFQNYYGNIGYTFRNKYTLTVSGRVDKSNFFGAKENQRMVPLYSAGAGWIISDEKFYPPGWLQFLRLRATYGYNGNLNNKATALPTALLMPQGGVYHNQPYLALVSPPNPGLTWEKIGITNVGIDFRAANSRIDGSLEFYAKKGVNLIGTIFSDPTTGATNYVGNYASMKGKGIDLIFNSLNLNKTITWRTNFNFSYNTDKVTDYKLRNSISTYPGNPNLAVIGKPLSKIYSYAFAGLSSENGDPLGLLSGKPTEYSKVVTDVKLEDLIYHGSATPKIFGSLINTIGYKQLSLSFNITYKLNYYFYRSTISYTNLYNNWGGHSDYAFRWQKPGDETRTTVPSVPASANETRDAFYQYSSATVEKGDHIRLQDARLSFNLQKSHDAWLPFERVSIFTYANNLGIIWRANKHRIDPDAPEFGVPLPKSLALGLSITL